MVIMDRLHNYFESKYNLSHLDSIKLKYSLEIIFNDLSKLVILLTMFSIAGYASDFIYSIISLLMIRSFTGGIHLKSYPQCLLFTGAFFALTILLKNHVLITQNIYFLLFAISALIIIIFAPIIGENRPTFSKRKLYQFKLTGLFILNLHLIVYLHIKNHPYIANSIWVIFLQSIQILIANGGKRYENEKAYQK